MRMSIVLSFPPQLVFPGLIFAIKTKVYLSGAPFRSSLQSLQANTVPGCRGLSGTNALAYFILFVSAEEKGLKRLTPGPNVIKRFTAVNF
jgi:hypothetical protein